MHVVTASDSYKLKFPYKHAGLDMLLSYMDKSNKQYGHQVKLSNQI